MADFSGGKPSKIKGFLASLEAIDFQQSELLFRELEAAVGAVRRDVGPDSFKKANVNAIIKRHTNIDIEFSVAKSPVLNAWVNPPDLTVNNPILVGPYRNLHHASEMSKVFEKGIPTAEGSVDVKNSRVNGVFAKLKIKAAVTKGLLSAKDFTDAEIAAIMLHEIGHVFTYFEFLADTVSTNYALLPLLKAWDENPDKEYRLKMIKAVEKALNVTIEDKEALANEKNPVNVQVVFLDAKKKRIRSNLGGEYRDMRSWEYLSDQFASRHGAAKDLATALDKIHRSVPSFFVSSYQSTALFLFLEVVKVSKFLSGIVLLVSSGVPIYFKLAALLLPAVMALSFPLEGSYDDPEARLIRIKNQLLERLKDTSIDKGLKEKLLSDLDVLEEILSHVRDRTSFYMYLIQTLTPGGRKFKRQKELQDDLEKLAANYLFAKAAKLQNLS